MMPYIRAGMTHLAAEVRVSAVEVLGWLVGVAGGEVVGCAGGWVKTLNCFLSVLGWHFSGDQGWSASSASSASGSGPLGVPGSAAGGGPGGGGGGGKASFGKAGIKGRPQVRFLSILAEFLDAGIGSASDPLSSSFDAEAQAEAGSEGEAKGQSFPISTLSSHLIPHSIASPYVTLNLFGAPRDEEGEMYETREDRWRVFCSRGFLGAVERGVEGARGEGGEVGRVSSGVARVLEEAKRWNSSGEME